MGRRPFGGATVSDSIAAVLSQEPDWNALPAQAPDRLRDLLRRCLQKDPQDRLRDIGDARLELDEIVCARAETGGHLPGVRPRRVLYTGLTCLAVGAAIAAAVSWRLSRTVAPNTAVTRFTVTLPPGSTLPTGNGGLAWSRDGSRLAYRVIGREQMYMRAVNEFEAKPVPGTEGFVGWPSFSHNGEWIAFPI